MTLDEVIKRAEENADKKDREKKMWERWLKNDSDYRAINEKASCELCAKENRQLAEWLKDYKRLKELEPCEDVIRREDAINAVSEALEHVVVENEDVARKMMNKLPSVNPQPKTGHWIPVSEELPDKEGYYLCSVRYMYPPYNFFEPEKVKYMDDVTIQKFDGEFNIEVKAWMSLPPCYKPQESEE